MSVHSVNTSKSEDIQDGKIITAETLVPMDLWAGQYSDLINIDIAYASPENLLFEEAIYRQDARLWLHEDLAKIVLLAARLLEGKGVQLVLFDGLRTTDAQEKMLHTQRVKDNPNWLKEPRLLSPPGAGGHPRAMAVDLTLVGPDGAFLDMGTEFDFLAKDSRPKKNPAHRAYPAHSDTVMKNRQILEISMNYAADTLNTPLLALPEEWWDFRLPADIHGAYKPLSDADLPPQMRMTDNVCDSTIEDFSEQHFEDMMNALDSEIRAAL